MNDCIRSVLAAKGAVVHSIRPEVTVLDAVDRMNELHIGALLVVGDQGRMLGIFSERDVLRRIIGSDRDPKTTRVDEVMTPEVVTIGLEDTVMSAMILITDRRVRHLPVVEGDQIRGLVSSGDLTSWTVRDQQRTIEDLYDYIHRT